MDLKKNSGSYQTKCFKMTIDKNIGTKRGEENA
jgi:hypothetical protein